MMTGVVKSLAYQPCNDTQGTISLMVYSSKIAIFLQTEGYEQKVLPFSSFAA
jgi:hypothetical protein